MAGVGVERAADIRVVVAASAAGTAFEWYDFFVFVPLATIISRVFFTGLNESAAYVFALGSFAAGFAFRPLGALIFGRIGDRAGRKGAFLVTVIMMGAATFAIGLLPTYRQVGLVSPIVFIALRLIQGIALGGEWGGAAIFIAEHSPGGKRGQFTSWIGAAAAFGLGGALVVTLTARALVGEAAFAAWGWRIPFLASAVLVAVSVWFRLKLSESPVFRRMHAEGRRSRRPYADAFLDPANLRRVLLALFAIMVAQGTVWYTTFFYGQFFVEKVLKVAPETVNAIMIALVAISAPLYVLFGSLSDRIGRKLVMVGGMVLFTAALWPGFHLMTSAANPAMAAAQTRAPVTVIADPHDCSLQFDPVGKAQFRSSCDILKSALTNAGVSYRNLPGPSFQAAVARVGALTVTSLDGRPLTPAGLKAAQAQVRGKLQTALKAAGYPATAVARHADAPLILLVLVVLAVGATALYGPQAACLVELFPSRVRYTALSLPYHIGTGWVGGFLPATAYAMVTATGDSYFGLWYPTVGTLVSIVCAILFLPETRGRDLNV
ncbi:MFS transporter [Caulobacter sp. S45]|uniref:MFS transporter n=1 Tax=Caulobacter sp. S45 TaxID=1641861 RepID=UPI001575E02D|nr:MFS transporter [Caulobacter sp. S45]